MLSGPEKKDVCYTIHKMIDARNERCSGGAKEKVCWMFIKHITKFIRVTIKNNKFSKILSLFYIPF